MPRRGGLHGALRGFCLSRGCNSGSVSVVALLFHALFHMCVCVFGVLCTLVWRWAGQKQPAVTWGSLTDEEEFCFLHIPSLCECQSQSKRQGFYPLMNSDCWSKVWIIEFLINYPELLLDKSAPLQPPSSSVVFYLIWPASCSPDCPCLINADLVMETDAAVFWVLVVGPPGNKLSL